MAENATDSWITSELYVMYVAALGTVSRRQFVSNVTAHFGDELLVLHIDGCDSVVGFKAERCLKSLRKARAWAMMTSWRN